MRCVNAVNVTGDETVTVNFEFSRLNMLPGYFSTQARTLFSLFYRKAKYFDPRS